jgi:hypothetical protein
MVARLSLTQIQGQEEKDNMIAETIKLLIEVKELPKKASKDLKFAYGNDYLPFSFRDMFKHLKKIL